MKFIALMILFTGCIATNPPKSGYSEESGSFERFSRYPEPFKSFPDRNAR